MTDTLEPAATPRPVRRPTARSRPAPRTVNGQSDTVTLTRADLKDLVKDAVAAAVAPYQDRVEELERGAVRFVESEPPPKPVIREANPESVSPFTRKLLARTHAVPENFVGDREPAYNVPLRWYFKEDRNVTGGGDYVQLQGDAKNRALYEDLGFALLTPEETTEYLKDERPGIVREQQTRAALINGLRQLVKREAALSGYIDDMKWDESLAPMSIERLEEEWHNLCRQTANPERRLPTAERHRAERDELLEGVETTQSASREGLLRKLSAAGAQTRTIEVTRENAHMFS